VAERAARRAPPPWQLSFVLLGAIWGSSFLFIKVADEAFAPLQVTLGRMLIGTATLGSILVVRRERLPTGVRTWGHLAFAAVLLNAAPFTLFAWGETRVPSAVAGIWNATTPLLTLLVAVVALPDERPTRPKIGGLCVGFAGVLLVLAPWRGLGGPELLGNLACLGAAACYGAGFPYLRRFLSGTPVSTVSLSAGQLLAGSVELAIVTPLVTAAPARLPGRSIASVCALGVLCTGLAYVLNYQLIRSAGATTASTVTYLIPVFATVFGVLLLGERLSWNQPVGALIIVSGIAVSQNLLGRRRRVPTTDA
jgi:drug/metabolite transporter (DMT)-like permease